MVRIRHAWLVGFVALGLVAGCKKDAATSGSGDKPGESAAGGGAAAVDDLSFLPPESEAVIGINAAQMQQSALWKTFVAPKLMTGDAQRRMTEFKARCGWDPASAITTVTVAVKDTAVDKPTVVAVIHGFDKTKSFDCLDKSKDEIAKDGTEMTRDGDVILVKPKHGAPIAFTFVNNSTALALAGDTASAAGVKALAAGTSSLKSSPAFLDMYKQLKTTDTLWLLANGKVLDKVPGGATAAYGSLNVTDGLAFDGRVRFATPDAATQAASMGSMQAKQAAKYVDKAEFTAEGNEVHGSVVLSNQKLQTLIQELGPMLGMLTGMGGGQ